VDARIGSLTMVELELAFARSRRTAMARRAVAARRAALIRRARRTLVALLIALVALSAETSSNATAPAPLPTAHRSARVANDCPAAGPFLSAFRTASRETGLTVSLLVAVSWQESRMDRNALSPAGARGLLQLMPGTAEIVGMRGDGPRANIAAGARYLRRMLDRFDGDLDLALSAYNAGPTAVANAGAAAPTIETLRYVKNVEARAEALANCA
jgi:soluble lytic murein transglycosylase-like protein